MTRTNGSRPRVSDEHFLASVSRTELLDYLYSISSEMEEICERRGLEDLSTLFATAREKIGEQRK